VGGVFFFLLGVRCILSGKKEGKRKKGEGIDEIAAGWQRITPPSAPRRQGPLSSTPSHLSHRSADLPTRALTARCLSIRRKKKKGKKKKRGREEEGTARGLILAEIIESFFRQKVVAQEKKKKRGGQEETAARDVSRSIADAQKKREGNGKST